MYRDFFGFKHLPFKITPDLTFFYKHASRENIVHSILYSLSRGDGIIKVVGEVGSGKTTLLRLVSRKIPANVVKVFVTSPNLSPVDFLKSICSELEIPLERDALKLEAVKALQLYLMQRHKAGQSVVLLVDEAQSMMVDTLEEVRLLANLETQTKKLLQIVLFGQPELDVTLNDKRLKPLKDRIASSVYLPSLDQVEVMRYLNSRVYIAGYTGSELFDAKTSKKIHKITNGLPRGINLLADKLLMAAFSDDSQDIKEEHFRMIGKGQPWYKNIFLQLAVLTFIIFLALIIYSMVQFKEDKQGLLNSKNSSLLTSKEQMQEKNVSIIETKELNFKEKSNTNTEESKKEEVLKKLLSWHEYWSQKQVVDYLAIYSKNYLPQGIESRETWEKSRRLSIQKPAFIKVSLTNINVSFIENNKIETSFLQDYKSDRYSDFTYKKIIWVNEENEWKIIKEITERKLRRH